MNRIQQFVQLVKTGKANKFVVAAIGVVLTGLNVLYGTNPTVQLVIALATAGGVYQTRNN